MKKLMLMAIGLMATVCANAQVEESDWSIMPKVGVGIADMTGKLLDPDKAEGTYDATLRPITSLVAGFEAEYGMIDQLSIAFGMVYCTQGSKTKDNMFKVSVDYLNIPITVQYYPIPNCGLAIKAGAQLGLTTRNRVKVDGVTYSADYIRVIRQGRYGRRVDYIESELSKQFNKVDFSIPVGISYELFNFVLDARYNIGLTNVMKDDPENSKNMVWQFTLGYKFHFGD